MQHDGADRQGEVDGLQALAVLLVALFHAQLNDFRGGFVGVDVFFVISGYLIIPMIVRAQAEGRFAFRAFMARRLRRLVPALLPVLVFSAGAAALLLGAGRFSDFLATLAGAGLFVSNQVFLAQAGYFDTAAAEKLLLHTWSLGVEFQFYLLTPFLLGLVRGRPARVTALLAVLCVMSLGLSLWMVEGRAEAAFFTTPPRFWEFGVGGLVGLWRGPRAGPLWAAMGARGLGLGLILWAALSYDAGTRFPGVWALPPVLGAALVLAAPRAPRDPFLRLLAARGSRWLGLRSYSMYLWHWPLIVTAQLSAERATEGLLVGMVLLSILAAALSYRWVETPPQRRAEWLRPARIVTLWALAPALALGLWAGGGAALRADLPLAGWRAMADQVDAARAAYMAQTTGADRAVAGWQCSYDTAAADGPTAAARIVRACLAARPRAPFVLVVGDSHGRDVFQALRRAFPQRAFALVHQSSCPALADHTYRSSRCFPELGRTLELARAQGAVSVVLASHWPETPPAALEATAAVLSPLGLPVAVIGASPIARGSLARKLLGDPDLVTQAGALFLPETQVSRRGAPRAREAALAGWAAENGWLFVPKFPLFCAETLCRVGWADPQGGLPRLMFWDNQHLTLAGIDWLAGVLATRPDLAAFVAGKGARPQ